MANIEFKGFKLIYANGNSIDQVLASATTEDDTLYLVRTHDTGKDGYLVLNGKVYGSALEAKNLISDKINSLDATASTSGTKYISGTIEETNGKLTSFRIDETELEKTITGITKNITDITEDNGTIDTKINAAINGLNATATTTGTTYISGTTVEENGKLTSFTIDDTKLVTKIDQIDGAITAITGDTGTIKKAIEALDASVSGTSTHSGITVTIGQVDGKLTGVTVTDTLGTASKANVAEGTLSLPTGNTSSTKEGLTTAAQVENFVKASVADLAGAMHFKGVVTGNTLPDASGYNKGDVILMGTKEYVHDGSKWVELGDEGIYLTTAAAEANYVKKTTTIAGVALQNDITKEELLSKLNVADGAQVNKLEGVKVNGNDLSITDKKVNITVATGGANGTISVNGTDVAVKNLGSAAYESVDAFDASGTAANAIAAISGTTSGTSTNSYVTVATTQDHGKVAGITVNDSALKDAITGITNDINTLSGVAVKNVNGQTGNTITLTSVDIKAGADVDGAGEMTADKKVSEVLTDIYTKLNTAKVEAYTGITAADNTVTVTETNNGLGHSVAVKLKQLTEPEKASGLIQLVSAEDGSGIYGKLFFDGEEKEMKAPARPNVPN